MGRRKWLCVLVCAHVDPFHLSIPQTFTDGFQKKKKEKGQVPWGHDDEKDGLPAFKEGSAE